MSCCCGSSGEEDSEGMVKRLPASIQTMLTRATRTFSNDEIRTLSSATADTRCDALRMIFEGDSADEALAFILRECKRTRSLALSRKVDSGAERKGSTRNSTVRRTGATTRKDTDPPTSPATIEAMGSEVSGKSDESSGNSFPSGCVQNTQPATVSRRTGGMPDIGASSVLAVSPSLSHRAGATSFQQRTSLPSASKPEYKDATAPSSAGEGSDDADMVCRSISPLIRIPSPEASASAVPAKTSMERGISGIDRNEVRMRKTTLYTSDPLNGNSKVRVREAVKARSPGCHDWRTPTPEVAPSGKTQCWAWNEHFQTYIVHPNQLRCLEELEQQWILPTFVRPGAGSTFKRLVTQERRQFSGQYAALGRPHSVPLQLNSNCSSNISARGAFQMPQNRDAPRIFKNQERPRENLSPLTTSVLPLKNIEGLRSREDMFARLYSHNKSWTPRPRTAREKMGRSLQSGRTPPPRGSRVPYTPLRSDNYTPRRMEYTCSGRLPCESSHPHLSTRPRQPLSTNIPLHGQGKTMSPFPSRRRNETISPRRPPFSSTQCFRRTTTGVNPESNRRRASTLKCFPPSEQRSPRSRCRQNAELSTQCRGRSKRVVHPRLVS